MVTQRAARILRAPHYGIAVGSDADLVVLDCTTPEQAITELAQPLFGLKRGRRTFTREAPRIHRPT
jgi:cytosine deaminase